MARSTQRHRTTLALLAVAVLWPAAVHAGPGQPPVNVDLEYDAPAGCPSRGELIEQLGHRVDPSWQSGLDRRRFAIRIERLANGTFSGRLDVTRTGRKPQSRELSAETCRAVSAALVVFIAIALDPATDDTSEPEPIKPAPIGPAVEPVLPARSPPSASVRAGRPDRPRARAQPTWSWSSAASIVVQQAPGGAVGARVDGQLARLVSGSRLAPALRLSWGFADFETTPSSGGLARFRFQTARASACALVDVRPAPFTIAPCLGLDFGSLMAKSRNLPQVGETSTMWSAATGLVRASWSVLSWLAIEGEVGLLAPFTRATFALTEPVRIVYRAPSVLVSSGVGLALTGRFP